MVKVCGPGVLVCGPVGLVCGSVVQVWACGPDMGLGSRSVGLGPRCGPEVQVCTCGSGVGLCFSLACQSALCPSCSAILVILTMDI